MAVATAAAGEPRGVSAGRRFLVGTNVFVAVIIAVGIVVVLQLIAFKARARWDMTSSGVNSLGAATEGLLRGLEQNVHAAEEERREQPGSRWRPQTRIKDNSNERSISVRSTRR